ncbi:hypothetical protein L207DRAFT_576263 [Hyaloscypha variabilis F]|uniref:Rhodopsin domain-containing protein n=1 Tax=Hyaloscypha variabilis (strain UAMH 11265 / GT02V1 / F) TaxID=1149755 RepID=A0A2J6S9Q2_HYAVF|nr:hypothetical protein L207DRAFT_576263 [Hyaloscypha variabilis F]
MSVNDTACSPTGTCVILDGAFTNGTDYVAQYDPNYPVPLWRSRIELSFICIFNTMSLVVISARLWYRWRKIRRFRGDDRWILTAGLFLIPYYASQIGCNVFGSALHMQNVPEWWRSYHWHFTFGWAGYYIVISCIKMSVCFCFLHILPTHFRGLRYFVWTLCAVIFSLMLAMALSWWLACEPFDSNFVWAINSTECINYDIFRWLWVGFSIPIDIILVTIPLQILKRAKLRVHERKLLKWIFSSTLMGTLILTAGIYGVWETRTAEADDPFYHEAAFLMMTDVEIFMYAVGASLPVLSRYLVQRADPGPGAHPHNSNFSSWARYIPNFFPDTNQTGHTADNLVELETNPDFSRRRHDSGTSYTSGVPSSKPSRANSGAVDFKEFLEGDPDVERGKAQTEIRLNMGTEQQVLKDYVTQNNVIGKGW